MDFSRRIDEEDGTEYLVVLHSGGVVEIPLEEDEKGELEPVKAIAKAKYSLRMRNAASVNIIGENVDNIYANGEIVRTDYPITDPRAEQLLTTLESNFEGVDFSTGKLVGEYWGYREPYTGDAISWYKFEKPSAELLEQYGVVGHAPEDFCNWYGLKCDLASGHISLKVVLRGAALSGIPMPDLPECNVSIYAKIFAPDGTPSNRMDIFFFATYDEVVEYCEARELTVPVPTEDVGNTVWLWGIIYNTDTMEPELVKAYTKGT